MAGTHSPPHHLFHLFRGQTPVNQGFPGPGTDGTDKTPTCSFYILLIYFYLFNNLRVYHVFYLFHVFQKPKPPDISTVFGGTDMEQIGKKKAPPPVLVTPRTARNHIG